MKISWRGLLGLASVGGVALVAYLAVAWRPAIAPVEPPAPSFPADQVKWGEKLAQVGSCIACHTPAGKPAGSGGVAFSLPIGTFYSTNITPDRETGIGRWSLAAFTRALREGVSRDGKHLFPVFPFDHFTKLTDTDIDALYAYFMSLPAVKAPATPNTVPFPLDVRPLQAAWKWLYLDQGAFQPAPNRDGQWNRGAYLAEGIAHCGTCHTARNVLGGEQAGHPYGGAKIGGWFATALDMTPSPAPWTAQELATYLRTGVSPVHGVAVGLMRPAIEGLQALSDDDLAAIAAYFMDLNLPSGQPLEEIRARALSPPPPANDEERQAERLYVDNCAGCHERRDVPGAARSPMALNSAWWPEIPYNAVRIVLDGVPADKLDTPTMPGFRKTLTEDQLVSLIGYQRTSRTGLPLWPYLRKEVKKGLAKPPN